MAEWFIAKICLNLCIRLKVVVDEITPLNSIEKVFIGADWWENEVWGICLVFFLIKQISPEY